MSGPLEGFKVLDLSAVVSGPLTGAMLADQGATVTKVERVESGDIQRHVGSQRNGFSGFFHVLNRGKRSIAVDLGQARGIDIVQRLAADADVVVQNFRPGVVDRLGIGYAQLRANNPGLVYLSISGFGQTGPKAGERAYDPIIQTYSGIAAVQGRQNIENPDQPAQVNMLLMDKLTAYTGVQAITAALLARSRSHIGQHIELSMLDTAIAFAWSDAAADLILQGSDNIDPRPPVGASGQLLEYRDGWGATMTLSQEEFVGLCHAYDLDEVAADERFSTLAARISNRVALREIVADKFAAKAASMTLDEAQTKLQANQVPFSPVKRLDELPEDPQVQHNGILRAVTHPIAGPILEARPAPLFSGTPLTPSGPAPEVGQHTAEILAELGLADHYEELIREGIVS